MAGMFLRVVFVINLYKHIASWRTLNGFRILQENGMHSHFVLHLRDGLLKYPKFTFTLLSIVTLISLSYIIRIFEQPYYYTAYWECPSLSDYEQGAKPGPTRNMFVNFEEAVWLAVITMTTVGYGDVSAVTTFGRLTTVIIALIGTILVALLVATMSEQLDLTVHETRVLNEIKEQHAAAAAIQHSLAYNLKSRKRYEWQEREIEEAHRPAYRELKTEKQATIKKTDAFKVIRKERQTEVQTNEILFKHTLDLQDLQQRQTHLEENFEHLRNDVGEINKKLDLFFYQFFSMQQQSQASMIGDKEAGEEPSVSHKIQSQLARAGQ